VVAGSWAAESSVGSFIGSFMLTQSIGEALYHDILYVQTNHIDTYRQGGGHADVTGRAEKAR
jgi:hypothetical protein